MPPSATAPPSTADLTMAAVYCELRSLRVAETLRLAQYVAGDLTDRAHVVQLEQDGQRAYRTLVSGESFWWVLGMADAVGYGAAVEAIQEEPLPELLTVDEAAGRLPAADRWGGQKGNRMTPDGITYLINNGTLYPFYGAGNARHVFAAQVQAEALARAAKALHQDAVAANRDAGHDRRSSPRVTRLQDQAAAAAESARTAFTQWMQVRTLFPANVRIKDLNVDVTPGPSPHPLPVRGDVAEATRRVTALMLGHNMGWFRYLHPEPDGDMYMVEVGDVTRLIPGEGVLPWVLGIADHHGEADRAAYRAGLGLVVDA
jgi:hypothetical protein